MALIAAVIIDLRRFSMDLFQLPLISTLISCQRCPLTSGGNIERPQRSVRSLSIGMLLKIPQQYLQLTLELT